MSNTATVAGPIVSVVERAFQPFKDRQTNELRPGGVTYTAWVVEDFEEEPTEVKIRGDQAPAAFQHLREAGFARRVELEVTIKAQRRGDSAVVVRDLLAIVSVGQEKDGSPQQVPKAKAS
jgi:hypothetical protein